MAVASDIKRFAYIVVRTCTMKYSNCYSGHWISQNTAWLQEII